MTISRVRDQVRRYSRVSSSQASDEEVNNHIQQSIYDFCEDIGGLPLEAYLSISAKFDTETHFAVHIKIVESGSTVTDEDVVITSTQRSGATGATVASDLQTAIRAMTGAVGTETVTWSPFYFTIDFKQGATASGDSITISEPTTTTYADARGLLGLSSYTTSSTVITSSYPQDCTVESDLPTGAISIQNVEWDYYPLKEGPDSYFQSPESYGSPRFYNVRGSVIRLFPTPDEQEVFRIEYKGRPDDLVFQGYQECGLSGLSDRTATGLSGTTDYYFKVSVDGGAVTEYSITTAADLTYSAVIALMNAETTGLCTFSITGGDLRCTSDSVSGVSTISLSVGTTGTDLFGALTSFTAFETAVGADTDMPSEIETRYQEAVVYLAASRLLKETFEYDESKVMYSEYHTLKSKYQLNYHSKDTSREGFRRMPPRTYEVSSDS